jgi:hypothetical protein
MAGEPKTVAELVPTTFKANLMLPVSDPDIPAGPGKESLRIDLGDIRPKVINWDVTTNTVPAGAENSDYLKVTVAGTYNGDVYGIGGMGVVTNVLTGQVTPVNLALGGYPILTAFDITSPYPAGTAESLAYTRTGFKSGDTVNFSWVASEAINKIAIWPFDAVLDEGMPTGAPVIVDVTGASGTASFVIPNAIAGNSAYVVSGQLFAAVRAFGDYTDRILSTSSFLFDNRLPSVTFGSVTYPVTQGSIKGVDEAVVELNFPGELVGYVKGALLTTEILEATTPVPVDGVHDVATLATYSFSVRRNNTEFPSTNGQATLVVRAYNKNNGKFSTLNVFVHIEAATFADPVAVVGNGLNIETADGGKLVGATITSVVKLASPNGLVAVDGATIGSWTTSNNGYTWSGTFNVADGAPRGANAITDTGLVTAAGTAVTLTGNMNISGFEERAVYFDAPFSPYAFLAPVTVDHEPNLVVKDVLGSVINPSFWSYSALSNMVVVDAAIANLNSTGQMFLYISQGAAP